MNQFFDRIIKYSFYLLFLITPLIFYPYTSELFEFNKIVFVYLATIVVLTAWVGKMITQKKILFSRTILDFPILVFLISQILSTIFSIDFRTSLLGYYSRFNGGLVSTLCYTLLYWAFVSNIKATETKKSIRLLLISALIVSVFAIFEHFGMSVSCLLVRGQFNVACWVQDVQNRVFATLGQPNWLAAWLLMLFPLTWALSINKILKPWIGIILSSIIFLAILYTKSRSGLIAFGFETLIFWSFVLIKNGKGLIKKFLSQISPIVFLLLLVGTSWTPSIFSTKENPQEPKAIGPALETGGTESGRLREIVWQGAIDLWKSYPVFGSGVETFGFAYFETRPASHNLTSEWDYIYNKAHNEYLNYAANIGTIGLVSYLILITFILYQLFKLKTQKSKVKITPRNFKTDKDKFLDLNHSSEFYNLRLALLAGFASLLVTNFFGFSTVSTSLLFFLFPAMVISLGDIGKNEISNINVTSLQKLLLGGVGFICLYFLYGAAKYWYADFLYAKSLAQTRLSKFSDARKSIEKAVALSPLEAIYLVIAMKLTKY